MSKVKFAEWVSECDMYVIEEIGAVDYNEAVAELELLTRKEQDRFTLVSAETGRLVSYILRSSGTETVKGSAR